MAESTSKKTPARAPAEAATKSAASKSAATKTDATNSAATKTAATKTPATKTAAKSPAGKKSAAAKKSPAEAPAAKKSAAKKSAAKKPAAKVSTAKQAPAKQPATKKPAESKPADKKAAAKKAGRVAEPRRLAVRGDESPWTAKELAEVRSELEADQQRLRAELSVTESELADLLRDAGDGAGNDQADVGSNTLERDHEMSLVANWREMLQQVEHALDRIADGSYGRCEQCGNPIGKRRLMAFPRATLCMSCKQREERR